VGEEGNFIGQLCHIEAAEPGGERFNPRMTNEERRAAPNLMLMCYPHHRITNNVERYSVRDLKKMKAAHERRFSGANRAMRERLAKLKWGALVGAGVIAGIGIDEVVRRIESILNCSVRLTDNKKLLFRDKLEQSLRYAPSGIIYWYSRDPLHVAVGGQFPIFFEAAGWQTERLREDRLKEFTSLEGKELPNFERSMLIVFVIPGKEQVSNARQAIDDFFRRCGFSAGPRNVETLREEGGYAITFHIQIVALSK